MSDVHVLKFGGTSLKDRSFIEQAVNIVEARAETHRPVVVVSALADVTNRLIYLADELPYKSEESDRLIEDLKKMHLDLAGSFSQIDREQKKDLETLFEELKWVYTDVEKRADQPGAWRDHILSFGERASARIFAFALSSQHAGYPVESQHIIKTDNTFGEANVIPELTRELVRDALTNNGKIPVVTGFIGSTKENQITTLGRSGSDYTAGLITEALQADHLEIWTDVDGVLTADPNIVPTADHIDRLSFDDISELSEHRAKVIHPKTIRPIKDRDVSIQVRNSHNPDHPGTLIHRSFRSNGSFRSIIVTGPFTYFEVPAAYIQQLNRYLDKIIGSTTNSDDVSYSRTSLNEPARFIVRQQTYDRIYDSLRGWAGRKGIELSPTHELHNVKIFTNRLYESDRPLNEILEMLNRKGIRPITFHRGRQQRHISLLLQEKEAFTAARLINDYQIDSRKTVDLFVAGIGAIGDTLIRQIGKLKRDDIRIRVIGLCNSKYVFWDKKGLDLNNLPDPSEAEPTNWPSITGELTRPERHNTIFVDATGSAEVARIYPELMREGIHIATPSKLANTFEQSFYDRLQEQTRQFKAEYRYETTVGAGLPVISTIHDLLDSGDTIREISGVVSGTMTYLFNQLEQGIPFSRAIIDAREKGYAEPDPRDDLSGEDVARKFLILARTLGHQIERSQLSVESLIPDELQKLDADAFLERLPETDDLWTSRMESALERGETLRYSGTLKQDGSIDIGIRTIPKDSPLGQLKGTDNLIQISTDFYSDRHLIIQGPGAGKEVTAGGLLADILKIAKDID